MLGKCVTPKLIIPLTNESKVDGVIRLSLVG